MSFRYGNFFGVSAVHLMYMRASDIDSIFCCSNLSGASRGLLAGLYTELKALKCIFGDSTEEYSEKVPHVIMSEDSQSEEVKNFIKGFNCLLERKKEESTREASEPDYSSLLSDETSSPDEGLSDLASLDFGDSLTAENTGFFSDNSVADKPQKEKSMLAGLFGEDEVTNAPTEKLDAMDSLANLFDSADFSGFDASLAGEEPTVSETSGGTDLIKLGASSEPERLEVKSIPRIRMYLASHKDMFAEEKDSILEQLASLPRHATKVDMPEFDGRRFDLSDQSRRMLDSLYKHMYDTVRGVRFVDYVLDKISYILNSQVDSSSPLFFTQRVAVKNARTYYAWKQILIHAQQEIIHQHKAAATELCIDTLLNNCKSVREVDASLVGRQKAAQEYLSGLSDPSEARSVLINLLGNELFTDTEWNIAAQCFDDLNQYVELSKPLEKMVLSHDSLQMILSLCVGMHRVCTRWYTEFGDNDATLEEFANKFISTCIAFTEETGICGFYCEYLPKMEKTIFELGVPVHNASAVVFNEDDIGYDAAGLLRKHLLSLKKRGGV